MCGLWGLDCSCSNLLFVYLLATLCVCASVRLSGSVCLQPVLRALRQPALRTFDDECRFPFGFGGKAEGRLSVPSSTCSSPKEKGDWCLRVRLKECSMLCMPCV